MIEVSVDGNPAREKLFDTYDSGINGNNYITPKNNEIKKYCKFLKKYYPVYTKETNYLDLYFVMELEGNYEKTNYFFIANYECFLFEFPDEETAFYFKLKYC